MTTTNANLRARLALRKWCLVSLGLLLPLSGAGPDQAYAQTTSGPNAYCIGSSMTAMTQSNQTIENALSGMTALGNTFINQGLVWGWRMLSPKWRGYWGGDMDANNLPLNYGTPHMQKAVVLLSDGENYFSSGIYTAYSYLSNNRLGTTTPSTAANILDARTLKVCQSMKDQGVIIYAIALGDDIELLKSCATGNNYYFHVPSAAELTSAFKQIADSLSNLRVSK